MASSGDPEDKQAGINSAKKTRGGIFSRLGRSITKAFSPKRHGGLGSKSKNAGGREVGIRGDKYNRACSEVALDVASTSPAPRGAVERSKMTKERRAADRCVSEGDLLSAELYVHSGGSSAHFGSSIDEQLDSGPSASGGGTSGASPSRPSIVKNTGFQSELALKLNLRRTPNTSSAGSDSLLDASLPSPTISNPGINTNQQLDSQPETPSGESFLSGGVDPFSATPLAPREKPVDTSATRGKLAVTRARNRRSRGSLGNTGGVGGDSGAGIIVPLSGIVEEDTNTVSSEGATKQQLTNPTKPAVLSPKPTAPPKPSKSFSALRSSKPPVNLDLKTSSNELPSPLQLSPKPLGSNNSGPMRNKLKDTSGSVSPLSSGTPTSPVDFNPPSAVNNKSASFSFEKDAGSRLTTSSSSSSVDKPIVRSQTFDRHSPSRGQLNNILPARKSATIEKSSFSQNSFKLDSVQPSPKSSGDSPSSNKSFLSLEKSPPADSVKGTPSGDNSRAASVSLKSSASPTPSTPPPVLDNKSSTVDESAFTASSKKQLVFNCASVATATATTTTSSMTINNSTTIDSKTPLMRPNIVSREDQELKHRSVNDIAASLSAARQQHQQPPRISLVELSSANVKKEITAPAAAVVKNSESAATKTVRPLRPMSMHDSILLEGQSKVLSSTTVTVAKEKPELDPSRLRKRNESGELGRTNSITFTSGGSRSGGTASGVKRVESTNSTSSTSGIKAIAGEATVLPGKVVLRPTSNSISSTASSTSNQLSCDPVSSASDKRSSKVGDLIKNFQNVQEAH